MPSTVGPWVTLARNQNLLLRSEQLDARAARQRIETKKMDFLPTVSAIANYSDVNQLSTEAIGGSEDAVRGTQVGLSATWNIFQGGGTISDIKQARANYAKATADMEQRYLQAISSTQNAFIGVSNGLHSVEESRSAMQAGISGLKNVNKGFNAGIQSIFEVLQAQNRLYESQKQYTSSYYNYLLNTILLKQAAGTLSPSDAYQLNNYLYGKTHENKKQ